MRMSYEGKPTSNKSDSFFFLLKGGGMVEAEAEAEADIRIVIVMIHG